jgi:hypothetical protein
MTAHGAGSAGVDGVLSAEEVAQTVVDTMRDERFLSLPHAEVETYLKGKAQDYDRWLGGMQKMYARHMSNAAADVAAKPAANAPGSDRPASADESHSA